MRERKIPGNVAEKYGEKCEMKHARNMLQMFRIIVCHLIALWHNLIAAAQQQQPEQQQQLREQLLNRLLTEYNFSILIRWNVTACVCGPRGSYGTRKLLTDVCYDSL